MDAQAARQRLGLEPFADRVGQPGDALDIAGQRVEALPVQQQPVEQHLRHAKRAAVLHIGAVGVEQRVHPLA